MVVLAFITSLLPPRGHDGNVFHVVAQHRCEEPADGGFAHAGRAVQRDNVPREFQFLFHRERLGNSKFIDDIVDAQPLRVCSDQLHARQDLLPDAEGAVCRDAHLTHDAISIFQFNEANDERACTEPFGGVVHCCE